MVERRKYSIIAHPDAVSFLLDNGIAFVFRNDLQKRKHRLYFITDPETANELEIQSLCYTADETDGWGFDGWAAIE